MGKPRFAIFIPSLKASGLTRVMLNLARGLVQRGFAVDIVVLAEVGEFSTRIPTGVRTVELGSNGRWTIGGVYRLLRYVQRVAPSVLISAMNHGSITALLAAQLGRSGTKSVVTIHTHLPTYVERFGTGRTRLTPLFISLLYPLADHIVAVSEGAAEGLARTTNIPDKRINVIYNPVVDHELIDRSDQMVDHDWFDDGEGYVILGVGRLEEHKDYVTVFESLTHIPDSAAVRLVLIGDGSQRDALEDAASEYGLSDRIDFLGFVQNPYPYMREADAFVFSSYGDEGLPTVIIEALACGCPVVATDCESGPSEILDGSDCGELVPVGDAEAMAAALWRVLNNPPDRSRLLDHALQYSISRATSDYLRLIFGSTQPGFE